MVQLCKENDIKILPYGSVAGGLLSNKFRDNMEQSTKNLLGRVFGKKFKSLPNFSFNFMLFYGIVNVENLANLYCFLPRKFFKILLKYTW